MSNLLPTIIKLTEEQQWKTRLILDSDANCNIFPTFNKEKIMKESTVMCCIT